MRGSADRNHPETSQGIGRGWALSALHLWCHHAVSRQLQSPRLFIWPSTSVREEDIQHNTGASSELWSLIALQTSLLVGGTEPPMFVMLPLQSVHNLLLCLGFPVCKTDCHQCPVVGIHCCCAQGWRVSRSHLHIMNKTVSAEGRSKQQSCLFFSSVFPLMTAVNLLCPHLRQIWHVGCSFTGLNYQYISCSPRLEVWHI